MAKYMAYNTTFILKVGDFVFLHGGITLDIIKNIKEELNEKNPNYRIKLSAKCYYFQLLIS